MANSNKKPSKPDKGQPAGAPELTEEQKQEVSEEVQTDIDAPEPEPTEETTDDDGTEAADQTVSNGEGPEPVQPPTGQGNPFSRLFGGYWRRKLWTLPLTLLVLLAAGAAIPASRVAVAALFISHQVTVSVIDKTTSKPVSGARVSVAGKTLATDKNGKAQFSKIKVGEHIVTVAKKYYKDETVTVDVPITKAANRQVEMIATGRQVPVAVVNKISGAPLDNVTLVSAGTDVKTDKDGKAVIVLPADKATLPITIKASGYNQLETKVQVTEQTVKENSFVVTPSGSVYFLSKASGKVDVVKIDLDGANRQTIVAGTGKEEDSNTTMLASSDWKYLALLSKRDSGLPRLYLIDTSTDKMSEMDSGDASFSLVGWQDHNFVYHVTRNKPQYYEANKEAFKSYDAEKRQIFTIDQNAASGDANSAFQRFSTGYLVSGRLVYASIWQNYYYSSLSDHTNSLRVASVNSSDKKDVKTWPLDQYGNSLDVVPGGANRLFLRAWHVADAKERYYSYENGVVSDSSDLDDTNFWNRNIATYLLSPDRKATYWSEQRDGRQGFFVGDANGANGKQIANQDEGQAYAWYTADYVLFSKKGSELYIMPAGGGTPIKIADYHKPANNYYGYGGM